MIIIIIIVPSIGLLYYTNIGGTLNNGVIFIWTGIPNYNKNHFSQPISGDPYKIK